ncbi:SRPBCC domain-containing protein [Streptomyces sp. NPDC059396]|uniref:SRPBCC domain-containing protein n=1 Tax=Streptomyces sp. NPDC059396 TaxID=3346819 RepID=UPI0036A5BA7B
MEHEVFVPVAAEALRQTLRDPARVARCVPGFQQDADASAGPLSGRLRVRIGGHTITYRGTLTLAERDGVFTAEGEGAEARGSGAAKLTLVLRLAEAPDGTTLTFTGGSSVDGRLADLPAEAVTAAAHRLLDRLAAGLGEMAAELDQGAGQAEAERAEASDSGNSGKAGEVAGAVEASGASAASDHPEAADAVPESATEEAEGEETAADEAEDTDEPAGPAGERGGDLDGGRDGDLDADDIDADRLDADDFDEDDLDDAELDDDEELDVSVFEVDLPSSSLDGETISGEGDFIIPGEPPAEAAHARRTMIGRSAEEVDHAPPRGRYAPVPAPDPGSAGATLRWVAPAAALALASAVVVGRALRRRK